MTAETNERGTTLDDSQLIADTVRSALRLSSRMFESMPNDAGKADICELVKGCGWRMGVEVTIGADAEQRVSLVVIGPQGERRPLLEVLRQPIPGATQTVQ